MALTMFRYTDGYTYDEYRAMCDRFKDVKLPFYRGYDVNRVLAEYVFGYSMKRFPTGCKRVLRRFFGGLFLYPFVREGDGNTAFLFSGDGVGRPDYVSCIKKAAAQCEESCLYLIDRQSPRFCIRHIFGIFPQLIWAAKLNKTVKNRAVSFDMAVFLYRAKKQGERLYRLLKRDGVNKLVTFCDLWCYESVLTQRMKKDGIPTATLQHGNGTDILYGSCSDYYLANSKSSKANAVYAGLAEEAVVVVGPMKYAGETFTYKAAAPLQKLGIVFDGAQNFENNVEMLQTVHEVTDRIGLVCCIRFHPNNRREDYGPYMRSTDTVYDELDAFENDVDLCVVYNSSMYTDMIYKRIPVYRYKNGKVDLFPELDDKGFSDAESFARLLERAEQDHNACIEDQERLYDKIFGAACEADSYRQFFKTIFR